MLNVYALLNPVSAIQSLLGTGSSPQQSRIYLGVAPERVSKPFVECHLITDTPISTILGISDPRHERIQFSCVGSTHTQAESVAEAIRATLQGNGYQEYMGGGFYDPNTKNHTVILDWSFIV